MSDQEQQDRRVCPTCATANALDALARNEYRCGQCKLELAHVDFAANGVVRGIFGWLRVEGDTVEGRYRVKSVLGKGGFGATYLVEDVRLNGKRRALKEVPTLLFDEYETNLLSRLNHPAIPDIVDRSESGNMVYLVLEFGGNRTLGAERKQYPNQRIPLAKLLPWMRQLCEVLAYLHAQEPPIIHRDLKPDNVLLDENGRIMLIDFGIAKESKPATMTRTLGRAATHGFSPPEQAMGTGTNERSDIYALGATFYALLTGENPPAAHERVSGTELTSPAQFVSEIPPSLEEAILRALDLNINRRQQSVAEFRQVLESIDMSSRQDNARGAAYTGRTMLIGSTSDAAIYQLSDTQSARGKTAANKPLISASAGDRKNQSKRFARLAVTVGGIMTIAVVVTTAYSFRQKSEEHTSPLPNSAKTALLTPATHISPPVIKDISSHQAPPIKANSTADELEKLRQQRLAEQDEQERSAHEKKLEQQRASTQLAKAKKARQTIAEHSPRRQLKPAANDKAKSEELALQKLKEGFRIVQ